MSRPEDDPTYGASPGLASSSRADMAELLRQARESGDLGPLAQAMPTARFLGLSLAVVDDRIRATLRFAPHLVGNALIPALHGGTVASLLEAAAFFQLLWEGETLEAPRIIGITVDYLRTARTVDTFAGARITRQGRRIATVQTEAWQEDPARPVAAARAHFLVVPRG